MHYTASFAGGKNVFGLWSQFSLDGGQILCRSTFDVVVCTRPSASPSGEQRQTMESLLQFVCRSLRGVWYWCCCCCWSDFSMLLFGAKLTALKMPCAALDPVCCCCCCCWLGSWWWPEVGGWLDEVVRVRLATYRVSTWTRLFAQSSTKSTKTAIYSLAYIYIKQVLYQINSWTMRHK